MSLYRVTHIDEHRRRTRVWIMARDCRHALAQTEQLLGDALAASLIRQGKHKNAR